MVIVLRPAIAVLPTRQLQFLLHQHLLHVLIGPVRGQSTIRSEIGAHGLRKHRLLVDVKTEISMPIVLKRVIAVLPARQLQ